MNKLKFFFRDFRPYFISSRLLVFLLFQFTVMHYHLREMIRFSADMNFPISPWLLPFLFQSIYMQFIYGISTVYFFSTVPFFQRTQLYVIIRQGRIRWMLGKILRIWLTALLLPCLEFLASLLVIVPRLDWTAGWGKVLHSLAVTDAASEYGVKVQIDYRMMSRFSPGRAMLEIMGLMILVTAFIGMWMLLASLRFGKMAAVVSATVFAVLPVAAANVHLELPVIVFVSPFSWLNRMLLEGAYRVSSPNFSLAVAMLFTGFALLTAGAVLTIRRVEFQWTKED